MRRAICWALVDVVALHGLLGWLYVAACAAFRPDDMRVPVSSVLPLRRDTFGILCFAASALAVFLLQWRGRPLLPDRPAARTGAVGSAIEPALRTFTAFALIAWAYLCVNSLTHPQTVGRQFTHVSRFPSEGQAAVICYLGSALAWFALRARTRAARTGTGSVQR